jgi:hypothetical protein
VTQDVVGSTSMQRNEGHPMVGTTALMDQIWATLYEVCLCMFVQKRAVLYVQYSKIPNKHHDGFTYVVNW